MAALMGHPRKKRSTLVSYRVEDRGRRAGDAFAQWMGDPDGKDDLTPAYNAAGLVIDAALRAQPRPSDAAPDTWEGCRVVRPNADNTDWVTVAAADVAAIVEWCARVARERLEAMGLYYSAGEVDAAISRECLPTEVEG